MLCVLCLRSGACVRRSELRPFLSLALLRGGRRSREQERHSCFEKMKKKKKIFLFLAFFLVVSSFGFLCSCCFCTLFRNLPSVSSVSLVCVCVCRSRLSLSCSVLCVCVCVSAARLVLCTCQSTSRVRDACVETRKMSPSRRLGAVFALVCILLLLSGFRSARASGSCPADVVVLVDGSGSITPVQFSQVWDGGRWIFHLGVSLPFCCI